MRAGFDKGVIAAGLLALSGCSTNGADRLAAELSARPSATAVLQTRCTQPIRALIIRDAALPLPAGPLPDASGYRHVRLTCGNRVLSDARNWYRRELLSDAMNRELDETDRPFGATVAALGFSRERLVSRRGRAAPCPAGTILSQRGLLRLPDGSPLALVIECYTRAALIVQGAE